jgi:ankyrin repeat protein
MLLDVGTPITVEDTHKRTALHAAAAADARSAAALLLERGADANVRESLFHATPLGFAAHHDHGAMIDLLAPYSRDVWVLAIRGKVSRLREVLAEEPQRALEVAPDGRTLLWSLPDDEDTALEIVNVLLGFGADPSVKMKDGTTAADSARALGLERVAERLTRS